MRLKRLRIREAPVKGQRQALQSLRATLLIALSLASTLRAADPSTSNLPSTFRQYCFQCHGNLAKTAGINIEQLTSRSSLGESFEQWRRVADALDQRKMPPPGAPQPSDAQRSHASSWIGTELRSYIGKHAGEPGRVTVRRLTSGEYAYAIEDLTGLRLDAGIDAASDSVGGEGFTNFGDVQFMQDANLERYLTAAKRIADHSVAGAGPLQFFPDPGKTGFELSAITRIRDIYTANGFRTVSGEGGRPFGLEKYGKAMYAAWRYRHRAAFGESNATLKDLAAREGINLRFVEHISTTLNRLDLGYPSSEAASRWRKLPAPGAANKVDEAAVRAACTEIQNFLVTWPSWLFVRGDLAAGGAGDESPLEFSDRTLNTDSIHRFSFVRGGRGGTRGPPLPPGPARIFLNVALVNPNSTGKPVIVWRNPTVGIRPLAGLPRPVDPNVIRRGGVPPGPRHSLRSLVSEDTAKRLNFGKGLDGTPVGPDDFASESSVSFEVPLPEGSGMDFQVDAEIGSDRDQVFRVTIADRADGKTRGQPVRALLGDMKSAGYKRFRDGVMELAAILPPNSHGEPTPADKDPVPEPFDNTYNVPEHDEFVVKVKYIRDDRFVVEYILDEATLLRLDQAWNDLFKSFEYHDNYLSLLTRKFGVDLKGKRLAELTAADIDAMPAATRTYVKSLRAHYDTVFAENPAARKGHIEDCLDFASRAWRRPLSEKERQNLRGFYDKTITADPDHRKAVQALLARILVAPAFLYRVEHAAESAGVRPLSNWELASRMSFFLWSSIPDGELRRAAAAGELGTSRQLERQVKRMLADPKARRLSTEFFGQWLGFYHFDQHTGVDTGRFPEFTGEVKTAMYDEAVSFFEHVIRKERPIREILFSDYAFLNKALAKHYGVDKEIKSVGKVELVEGANAFQRGGLLRLGAVLTATSAPLRTSPVKRGDWVLRRILGTPVPPPPADAGSIPADDKLFGGLSVHDRLEAHKRNPTCANCHVRIDPLGFPLERYDSIGRFRQQYPDGKPIDDSGTLADKTRIAGVAGLLDYLRLKEDQVRRTLSYKLLGYALGRTVLASDQPLIDRLVGAGGEATFSQLAAGIVTSPQFRNRLGNEGAPVQTSSVQGTPVQAPPVQSSPVQVGSR